MHACAQLYYIARYIHIDTLLIHIMKTYTYMHAHAYMHEFALHVIKT